jgi:hypothetical protein
MQVNAVATLDVNIIIDEGQDSITTQLETFDQLIALSGKGAQVPPELLVEASSLPPQLKKKWLAKLQQADQPDPLKDKMKQITVEGAEADVAATKAKAIKDAIDALTKAPGAFHPMMPGLDQSTLGLADTLESEQPTGGPLGGGGLRPGGPPMGPGGQSTLPPGGPGAPPGIPPGMPPGAPPAAPGGPPVQSAGPPPGMMGG